MRMRSTCGCQLPAVVVVTVAGLALVSACGSSGSASITIPQTAGLSVGRAVDALCRSGVRVTINQTIVPAPPSAPATVRERLTISITGTTPSAGRRVATGAVVVLHETTSQGVEQAFSHIGNCLAPVSQTITLTADEQAALHAVAVSAAGRANAAQFPSTAASKTCAVVRTAPAPPTRIPAMCATLVTGSPGLDIISFTEAWSGPNARHDDGFHTWTFLVQSHHTIELSSSVGDPPRRIVR
jgi:hypothetical protein